jgi:hypothetical protein
MGRYQPDWSAEEQTMIDLMDLAGYGVKADINKEYTIIHLYTPDNSQPLLFRDDTVFSAIRKAFKFWSDGKKSKYA